MSSAHLKNYRVVESVTDPRPSNPVTRRVWFADYADSNSFPRAFVPIVLGVSETYRGCHYLPEEACKMASGADSGMIRTGTGKPIKASAFIARLEAAPVEVRELYPSEVSILTSWRRYHTT